MDLLPFEDDDEPMGNYSAPYSIGEYSSGGKFPNYIVKSILIERISIILVHSHQLFNGFSSVLLNFATACCILFMLIGIPGNLITIIALARCKKVSFLFYKFSFSLKL